MYNHNCLISTPNSGGSYYFRTRIPKDLSSHFNGVTEFRLSLQCSIQSRSKRIAQNLNQIVLNLFDEIRNGMKSLEIEDIKEILRIEIRKQILHSHHIDFGTNKYNETKIQMSLDSVNQREVLFMDTLRNDMKSHKQELNVKLEGILNSLDIEFKKDSIPYKTLSDHFTKLYTLRFQWMRDLIEVSGKTDDDFRRDAQTKLGLELFPELSTNPPLPEIVSEPIQTTSEPIKTTVASVPTKESDADILVTIQRYLDWKRMEDVRQKTIQEEETFINEFFEIVGEKSISEVSKSDVTQYIQVQSKLPPNRKKSPEYRDFSIAELVKKNIKKEDTQSNLNINKRLTRLTTFGHWCIKQGYIESNPFKGMKLSVKKSPRKKRQPFSVQDLKKILKPEIYLDWTINYKHALTPNRATNQNPYYWIFPLGILSGLRTNEMCQLRCSDIREEKRGLWFIYVEESDDTMVKTQNSIRKIPVHPTLKELGFIDYVGNLRRKKKDRVFWELEKSRDGYSKKVSRHYNEKYLPAVGVWEKNVKVLYCTRHTFINCLYSKNVDENVIKTLVGHEEEFTMKHYGGEPFSPERLLKEISKVSYNGINWNKLKVF